MFGFFKKKELSKASEDKPHEEDAKFYQAVINKFVTMIDEYAESDANIPAFRDRWRFSLANIEAWRQSETLERMSCLITATDVQGEFGEFSEWAHGFGDTSEAAFNTGFSNWITTDLPVLIDVIQGKAVLSQEVSFQNKSTEQTVRGILGPMQLWSFGETEPKFCCNVCIFSQALKANDGALMSQPTPYLIKAVVARNADNTTSCDFRINGEQDEGIASTLSEWAKTWEGQGFSMRKQSLLFV